MTRSFVASRDNLPLPTDRVVLEILENTKPEPAVIDGLELLRATGYRIALDDFIYDPALRPLLQRADLVKVEVPRLTLSELAEQVQLLRPFKVMLLAEKIETPEVFEACRRLGFDYFQGYFLSRPSTLRNSDIPANRLRILELLAALQRADVQVAELEELISRDLALSYKLLRYLNSAFFSLPRRIDSIRQAVLYLGTQELRTWAALLALASIPGKPHELSVSIIIRARFCETAARIIRAEHPARYFMVGLLSGLDALLDAPLEQILERLPVNQAVAAALLRGEGGEGEILDAVRDLEIGRIERIRALGLSAAATNQAYVEAVRWAENICSA
ncbi:EAL and HDOD domain-containing protein [Nitrococcus mobilis]|uniref:Diguanylate phosphodiesterase n=1 Tax=Nitrococcus mobilis Nb-231 TaxID=314278 RepID=A4BVS5_9GAMM|nr:HDOD domain-containing protein [Nitrococcus mobilis]EAR20197.1 diguanylate phosphodiesterase [Nitrococcus mobilis Nb-231]